MISFRQGLTARVGIIIIAIAVVVVGVVVYFVFTQTKVPSPNAGLSISIQTNPIILEKGATVTIPVKVTSSNTTDPLSFTATASAGVDVTLTNATINPSGSTSLIVTGTSETTTGSLQVTASQGTQTASATAVVKIIESSTNSNTTNTNSQTNQNSNTNAQVNSNSNTNTSTGLKQAFNSSFKFSFMYQVSWGDVVNPTLVRLAPTQGSIVYNYFSNLSQSNLPGNIIMSAASANYVPHDFSGTPQWFATTFTPLGTEVQIAKEVTDAGFKAYDIKKVTIDGKPAIRMLYLRGYVNNYLDVSYVIYDSALSENPNLFLTMSIDYIKNPTDTSDVTDNDVNSVIARLTAGTLSDQAMRRYNQFEAMIKSIQFTQ